VYFSFLFDASQHGINVYVNTDGTVTAGRPSYRGFRLRMIDLFRHVGRTAKSDLASSRLSVCQSACKNSVPTGRIFMKFVILGFFSLENPSEKIKVLLNIWITLLVAHF
jgi:hypothetical protein